MEDLYYIADSILTLLSGVLPVEPDTEDFLRGSLKKLSNLKNKLYTYIDSYASDKLDKQKTSSEEVNKF